MSTAMWLVNPDVTHLSFATTIPMENGSLVAIVDDHHDTPDRRNCPIP